MPSPRSPSRSQWQLNATSIIILSMYFIAFMGWMYTDRICGGLSKTHFGLGILVLVALGSTNHFAGWYSGIEQGGEDGRKHILDVQERGAVVVNGSSSTPATTDTIPTTTGRLAPPPAYRTIYPLQHGTPVLNDRGEIPIKHNSFMCIAVRTSQAIEPSTNGI
ncbi:hypothetical protein DL95DRAFT_47865 [Leptodontidium sp. 2 PMI_412]|nr:hypothetical protein DL95DRAFT_47865 [Leptodontidium sp. 2 PMI_412]